MKRFDIVEIIEDVWKEDDNGHWACKYKIIQSTNCLTKAQEIHKEIILKNGDIMTPNGWHKYAIMAFSN